MAPALAADFGPDTPPANKWQFSFTPYGWRPGINGKATVRGHKVDINESFIEILKESDSIMALMGYFEARKGRFGLFTDVVWEDLGFPGHGTTDFNRRASGRPFAKAPNVNLAVDANLAIKANAQVDYQSTIIQSGAAFEVAKWGPGSTILYGLGPAGWCALLESRIGCLTPRDGRVVGGRYRHRDVRSAHHSPGCPPQARIRS